MALVDDGYHQNTVELSERTREFRTSQELWVGCLSAPGVGDGTQKAEGRVLCAAAWLTLDVFVLMYTQLF